MNSVPDLFDEALYARRQASCLQPTPLAQTLLHTIDERITDVARHFERPLQVEDHQGKGLTWPGSMEHTERPDLITIAGLLHTTNDLPGLMLRCKNTLLPDGFFVASLPGGDTLAELRQCFIAAEAHLRGGAAQRVHPMLDVRDAGALLQRAGFARPVAEVDRYTLTYPSMLHLLQEVRAVGETSCLINRSAQLLNRAIVAEAGRRYQEHYGLPDGRVSATLAIITMTGWAP